MSTMKARRKPLRVTGNKETIDYLHRQKTSELIFKQTEVPYLIQQREKINRRIEVHRNSMKACTWDARAFYRKKISELGVQRNMLSATIRTDSNGFTDYLYKAMPILDEYYNTDAKPVEMSGGRGLGSILRSVTVRQNDRLYHKYLDLLGMEHKSRSAIGEISNRCEHCKSCRLVHISFSIICQDCGIEANVLRVSSQVKDKSFNEMKDIDINKRFQYQRINHFGEWIENSQGIQHTDLPDHVIEALQAEITTQRLSIHQITEKKVRDMLKKLKLNKFYKYRTYITDKLTGREPLRFDSETVTTLKRMFMEIQAPFKSHQPKGRKSFLIYSFILHKFCQLLNLDNFLVRYPYLKNRTRLKEYDQVWKLICADVNYEFIPSI